MQPLSYSLDDYAQLAVEYTSRVYWMKFPTVHDYRFAE
jgi:hypothetical protein